MPRSRLLLVYLLLLAGFGVALFALLPDHFLLASTLRTALTLFEASLGNPNFYLYDDSDSTFSYLGLFLVASFTLLTSVIICNFVVVRMMVMILSRSYLVIFPEAILQATYKDSDTEVKKILLKFKVKRNVTRRMVNRLI